MRVWLLLSKATRYSVLSVLSSAVLSHESCKVLGFPPPSQIESKFDQDAAAFICHQHCYLQSELKYLRLNYIRHDDFPLQGVLKRPRGN